LSKNRTEALEQAEALLLASPTARYGLSTDSEIRPGKVVIGLAIRDASSCLIVVESSDYNGLQVLQLLDKHAAR
jgi:hypothetical protein